MYNIIRQGDADQNNILQYCCDTREDLAKLPTGDGAGSTCIVIATQEVYMFDEEDMTWKKLQQVVIAWVLMF